MLLPLLFIAFLVALLVFLAVQYSIFIPEVKGIAILMYHQVNPLVNNRLCIDPEKLEQQFRYLIDNGYTCHMLENMLDSTTVFPKRSFILTFDDGYVNNLEYLYPLLIKYNLHATIMLPVKFLGKENEWDGSGEKIMSIEQLKSMDSKYISFGLHTYSHQHLRNASTETVQSEIQESIMVLRRNNLQFLPVLAYPYGGFPREKEQMVSFFNILNNNNIELGLRIGNRINKWPISNKFLVKRIDIRGIDTFWEFKTKVKKGRVKMF